MYMHTYTYTYTYICIYIYIHIYIYKTPAYEIEICLVALIFHVFSGCKCLT